MKIECLLDYSSIAAAKPQPVHLAIRLRADLSPLSAAGRSKLAFCVVLDRSGSMGGKPLTQAKLGCEQIVRNLRPDDYFGLVTFDTEAQLRIPLVKGAASAGLLSIIRSIGEGCSTNLTGGWMLGAEELRFVPGGYKRRILLLSDGHLNAGITEPERVRQIVANGQEKHRIHTASLGFGNGYNEALLREIAKVSNGEFYDANAPEQLPGILKAELEGLQSVSAQNVRLRVRRLTFCDNAVQLSDYRQITLPDGRIEIAVGDLVFDEERVLVLEVDVPALPGIKGVPVTTLDGEDVLEVEIVWDEITATEVKSCRYSQIIRVLPVQKPEDVKLNEEVVQYISAQLAGKVSDEVYKDIARQDLEAAKAKLNATILRLKGFKLDQQIKDGLALLQDLLNEIVNGSYESQRSRKSQSYRSSFLRNMSSKKVWTGEEKSMPTFSQSSVPPPPRPDAPGKRPGDIGPPPLPPPPPQRPGNPNNPEAPEGNT
ncbi:MAG: VWA domain-containing protein [Candidatus Methylacidiphilales bacterium]